MKSWTRRFGPGGLRVAGVLLACAPGLTSCAPAPEPKVGDVVLIVVDTLRADAILDPGGRYSTPNIDALAADGVLFPRAFCHAPMTLPSHTALFTSRLPVETGVLTNGMDVPADLPLLAEWLAQNGYDTRGVIGLGTLKPLPGLSGLGRGFADFDDDIWNIDSGERVAARVHASLDRRDPAKPLFLFAHFSDPHSPYNVHDGRRSTAQVLLNGRKVGQAVTSELDNRILPLELQPGKNVFELGSSVHFKVFGFAVFENGRRLQATWEEGGLRERVDHVRIAVERSADAAATCEVRLWVSDSPRQEEIPPRYASEVEYVDRFVGQVLEDLKARGLYDDALVIFTSDHGESLGERELFGHVENLTDEQIHVPLIVKPPRSCPRLARRLRGRTERLVGHIDLVPTILELAQLPPLPGQKGTSVLRDAAAPHLAETHKPEAARDKVALRDARTKLIYVVDDDRFVMYDVDADPGETRDLFAQEGGRLSDWCQRLRTIGAMAARHEEVELDEEVKADLEALGYAR